MGGGEVGGNEVSGGEESLKREEEFGKVEEKGIERWGKKRGWWVDESRV